MSVGPLGLLGGIATTSLAQTKGADADRTRTDTATRARETKAEQLAENAAGLGRTEGEQAVEDRDADGRRLWEGPLNENQTADENATADAESPPKSKDASGTAGNILDLTG